MSETVVGPDDAGAALDRGGVLVIRLPELAVAGYRWRVSSIDPPIMAVESHQAHPGGEAPGAAGIHEFRLRATGTGVAQVDCELTAVWETVPEDRYTLRVTVR
jgi:predicted secreted protein